MRESTGTTPGFQAEFTKSTQQNRYDRYPGPRSFADNDVDQRLFFGREQEIEHLVHRVRAIRVLVLFGKSGLGKTSLLQAGLYPRLRERGLLPIAVRLNQPQIAPVDAVLEALKVACQTHGVDYEPRKTEGLWEFFKTTDLWRGDVLQTPVLVFDQFEEVFTLQSDKARVALASELGELAARGLPTRIRQRLQTGEQARYSDAPPEVKVILSLREEYVGALEDLVPNVPAIFEQRFRLAPLNQELARRAVVEPAELDESEVFTTRPFSYTDGALNSMMEFLVNRQGEVEPFQLQILCRYAEQQVARLQRDGARDVKVDDTLLGGRKAMETLLQNFYRNALWEIPSRRQRSRARCLCELGLLSPDGHRVSMERGQIRHQYKVSEGSLETLTQSRLMRREKRPGLESFYYELSHDSVARAVNRSRRFRMSTVIKVAFGGVLLLALSAAVVGFWSHQKARTARAEAELERTGAELAGARADVAQARAKEERARAEAAQARTTVEQARAEAAQAREKEERARAEAAQARTTEERARADAARARAKEERTQAEAAQARAKEERARAEVEEESSKKIAASVSQSYEREVLKKVFTLNDISYLITNGISPNRIAQLVEQRGVGFELDDRAMRRLKQDGANDTVLSAVKKMSARYVEERQQIKR